MKNFANVDRWSLIEDYSENLYYMDTRPRGEYVFYSDYEELLNAYRTLIDKMSEVVGDAVFEE